MYDMRMSGTMQFIDGDIETEDCGYTRRPYQLFMPVCREDLSGCVSGRSVGSLAISLCAAKPIMVPGYSMDWNTEMRFEGICKNIFWLISDLYKRTEIERQGIPIFISTNVSGWPRLQQYLQACGYPMSQVIVHDDEPPPVGRDEALPHGIKFDGLAHDRLSRFMRVLHIDAGERVPYECYGIWKDVLAAWPPGQEIVNGAESLFVRQRVPIPRVEVLMREVTGIQDLPKLRDIFFSRKTWPNLYAPCFGGSPTFWQGAELRRMLKHANEKMWGDGLCFAFAAMALSIEAHQCISVDMLTKHCIRHMEPLQMTGGELLADKQIDFYRLWKFFDSVQFCLDLHRGQFDMEIEICSR